MKATPKHFVPLVATVFVLLFLWLSAVPLVSWYEFSGQYQQLDDAEFKWHQLRLGEYGFEYDGTDRLAAGLPSPVRIEVRNGAFESAYLVENPVEIGAATLGDAPRSVEEMFGIARRLLEARPYEIDISYDPLYHYPARISVSLSESGDDSAVYTLRAFRAL